MTFFQCAHCAAGHRSIIPSLNWLSSWSFVSQKCSPCVHYAAAPCLWPRGLWVWLCCFVVDACGGGTGRLQPTAPQFLLYSPTGIDLNSAGTRPRENRGQDNMRLFITFHMQSPRKTSLDFRFLYFSFHLCFLLLFVLFSCPICCLFSFISPSNNFFLLYLCLAH